ncbi:GTPase HflX [Natranaerobius thermophilus]|uniref:GTPase HflX n=1 Tax=Natranaerobius thermophilus (strain ATCC BAA-1301 / DSM 18059 / JW/NM-WN-LF) TaxID=457570 RepID=B2A830_NATTJ|nr:GTPase HflX [Natranaerobius thermophilus]ACB85828.1 GTP-binding proten HflX [Natranaerobius thermophilus JW/NM-WN-LF]
MSNSFDGFDNRMEPKRAILVALEQTDRNERFSTEESLEELQRLADTAEIECVTEIVQKRPKPHPGFFIGKGKAREIGLLLEELDCNMVIFDDELSPGQIRNLEDTLDTDVWDRTALILDIFYRRANSKEAKLQVELARLEYLLPRLVGRGSEMSRLAGGIGTRGRGEQKLEIDRRHLREQIQEIRRKLAEVRKRREENRQYRKKHNLPVVSLVGYTNAGKSTLLSTLTGSKVTAKDELFNTLDPKLADMSMSSGSKALLSDTVGFINKLPHHLVAAFRATLEEVEEADLILHVIDASSPRMYEEIEAVEEVLSSLDLEGTPIIKVYNKTDLLQESEPLMESGFPKEVAISALKKDGLHRLRKAIQRYLESSWVRKEYIIPYHREDLKARLYEVGEVLDIEYKETVMEVYARVPPHEDQRLEKDLAEIKGGNSRHE